MAINRHQYKRKSNKYKYVYLYISSAGNNKWKSAISGNGKYFDEERQAARHVDKMLIEKGKEPVNIFKIKINETNRKNRS